MHRSMRIAAYIGLALLVLVKSGCMLDTSTRNARLRTAQPPTVAQTVTQQALALDSKSTLRTLALAQVYRPLLHEMVALLEVTPAVSQMPLTRDQLVTRGSAVVWPEIDAETWNGSTYVLQAKITIAPSKVIEALGRLQRDDYTVAVVERIHQRIDTSLGEIVRLRKALVATNDPSETVRLARNYFAEIQTLSAMQWLLKGLAYTYARNYVDAVMALSTIIEIRPQEAEAYSRRALAYEALQQHQQALEDLSRATQLSPQETRYLVDRAHVYEDLNEPERAFEDLTQALKRDPQLATAYISRGRVSDAMQQYQQALADFSEALKLAPQSGIAYYNRGTVYSKLGDYEHALADFSRALEVHPEDTAALNNRGALYGILGEHTQAIQDFTRVIGLTPQDAKAYYNRASAFDKLGKYTQAIADYSAALKRAPDLVEVHYNRGKAYFETGHYAEAVQDFTQAVTLQPKFAEGYYSLARAYDRLGKPEEAAASYRTAAQLGSTVVIQEAQGRLKTAGFDPGPVDGVLGPRTQAAIRKYQKARGFAITGRFDATTLQGLLLESSSVTSR